MRPNDHWWFHFCSKGDRILFRKSYQQSVRLHDKTNRSRPTGVPVLPHQNLQWALTELPIWTSIHLPSPLTTIRNAQSSIHRWIGAPFHDIDNVKQMNQRNISVQSQFSCYAPVIFSYQALVHVNLSMNVVPATWWRLHIRILLSPVRFDPVRYELRMKDAVRVCVRLTDACQLPLRMLIRCNSNADTFPFAQVLKELIVLLSNVRNCYP